MEGCRIGYRPRGTAGWGLSGKALQTSGDPVVHLVQSQDLTQCDPLVRSIPSKCKMCPLVEM